MRVEPVTGGGYVAWGKGILRRIVVESTTQLGAMRAYNELLSAQVAEFSRVR